MMKIKESNVGMRVCRQPKHETKRQKAFFDVFFDKKKKNEKKIVLIDFSQPLLIPTKNNQNRYEIAR